MFHQIFRAEAPSNIALIKYMGKQDEEQNLAANASLSYTLGHLNTRVEIEAGEGSDKWEPLQAAGWLPVDLSKSGQVRFLNHWDRLKKHLGVQGHFTIRSANNFPSDCGLASSASSFAALTKCAYKVAQELGEVKDLTLNQLTSLSREGSGSSCRSFHDGWVKWEGNSVEKLDLPYESLHHQVVIVDERKKIVSSSEAHRHVVTSLLFSGRTERAEKRLDELVTAFTQDNWRQAYEVIWAEFWDMHALFETSHPSFGYMTSGTLKALERVRDCWRHNGDGPLVTMDAGPNVHLLFRPDQKELACIMADDWTSWARIFQSPQLARGIE